MFRALSMNVVIFGNGFARPRQLNLSGVSAGAGAFVFAVIVSAAGFAGGYWYSTMTGSGISPQSNSTSPRTASVKLIFSSLGTSSLNTG